MGKRTSNPKNTVEVGGVIGTLTKREDRNNVYFLRFSHEGKQPKLTTGLTDLKEAKAKAEEIMKGYVSGVAKVAFAKSDALLSNCMAEYLEIVYVDNPKTGVTNGRRITILLNALESDLADDLTEPALRQAYLDLKARTDYQPHYWMDLLVAWKAFFKWAFKNKKIRFTSEELFENIKLPKSESFRKVNEILPNEDFYTMLANFDTLYHDVLMTMRFTSIYAGDCHELVKGHIKKQIDGTYKLVKKRQKAKTNLEWYKQPLNDIILPILLKRCKGKKETDKVFDEITEPDSEVFANLLSKRWGRRFRKEFPDRNPLKLTILRHVFITHAVASRVVQNSTLKKWVGHSPNSTELDAIYDHYEDNQEEMDAMMLALAPKPSESSEGKPDRSEDHLGT